MGRGYTPVLGLGKLSACPLVQRNANGVGEVEAIGLTRERNFSDDITSFAGQAPEAPAFSPKNEACVTIEADFC